MVGCSVLEHRDTQICSRAQGHTQILIVECSVLEHRDTQICSRAQGHTDM
jgi:hypothetical protein